MNKFKELFTEAKDWEKEINKILDKEEYAIIRTNKEYIYVSAVDDSTAYAENPGKDQYWDVDLDDVTEVLSGKLYKKLKKEGKL